MDPDFDSVSRVPATGAVAAVREFLRPLRVLSALSVVAGVAMGFNFGIIPVTTGLDPSWVYAYNYAAAHGLSWGERFISTYGPYGYLIATMDLGNLVRNRIFFALALAVGVGFAAAAYVRSVPGLGPGARAVMALALLYSFSLQDPEYQWFVFFLLAFLSALEKPDGAGLATFAIAGFLAGFFVLLKLSLGIGVLATLAFGCLLVRSPRRGLYRAGVAFPAAFAGFLIGWLGSGNSLGGLRAYLVTGLQISSGYSSAMSSFEGTWVLEISSLILWFALIALWAFLRPTPRSALILTALAFPLFMAWKHSIVRQDEHVAILARFGFFVVAILATESLPAWRWRVTLPVSVLLLIPLAVPLSTTAKRTLSSVTADEMTNSPLAFRGLKNLVRLSHLSLYRQGVAQQSRSGIAPHALPESMKRMLANDTVDVYPWDVSYVTANHLNWFNRPLPASFSGYTTILDNLNASFFDSPGRPKYLLWHSTFGDGIRSIDERHLFWDEPRTFRALVGNYDAVAETNSGILLLRSRTRSRFGSTRLIGTVRAAWNSWIPVPAIPGVLLAAPAIEPNPLRRFVRVLFRDDPMFVDLLFSSGQKASYRVVPDNMGDGLWLSPFVIRYDDLASLLKDGKGLRVVSMKFVAARWNASSKGLLNRLAPPVLVKWYQLLPADTPSPVRPSDPSGEPSPIALGKLRDTITR